MECSAPGPEIQTSRRQAENVIPVGGDPGSDGADKRADTFKNC